MRLLVAGVVSILLAMVAFTASVHGGADPCGSIVRPGSGAWTADCTAYQRLLLAVGGTGLVAGVAMVVAGRHVGRTAHADDDERNRSVDEEQHATSGTGEGMP